jgi:hypothetical protein
MDGAVEFALERRVLLARAANGIPVDIMLAALEFEELALRRARAVPFGGRLVKLATPEDLILHKVLAPRAVDIEDVRQIVSRQREVLDRDYLDIRVHELATLMEDPEIEERYLSAWEGLR